MVKAVGSNSLDQLNDAEAGGGSYPFGSDVLPGSPDAAEQRKLQEQYGSAGSDTPSTADTRKQDELQQRYGSPGSDKPSASGKSGGRLRRLVTFGKYSFGGKKKWFLAIGGLAAITVLIWVIGIILFLIGLLKIPNLAADITGVEFTTLIRQFESSASRTQTEALAYQTAGEEAQGKSISLRAQLQGEYADEESLLGRLQALRAGGIAGNLKVAGNIRLNYDSGGRVLKSITLVDDAGNVLKTVEVTEPSALDRIIPTWRLFRGTVSGEDARMGSQMAELINLGLQRSGVDGVGILERAPFISEALRRQIGASLLAFNAGAIDAYGKLDRTQADVKGAQDSQKAISGDAVPSENAVIPGDNEAVTETEKAIQHATADANEITNPEAIAKDAGNAAQNALTSTPRSLFGSIASVADPVYLLALTECTIYDGSIERAGPTINTDIIHQEREFYRVASIASQELAGGPAGLANAIGAANDQLGNITPSIPYQKANGTVVNTDNSIQSAETGGMGEYTLINASFPPDPVSQAVASNILNPAGEKVCGALLSPQGVGVAIGVQIGLMLLSLGTSTAAEVPTDAALEGSAREIAGQVAAQATTRITVRSILSVIGQKIAADGFWNRFGWFMLKEGVKFTGIVAGTEALTYLAKAWVYLHTGLLWSGLERGADLADAAGAGGNVVANEHERTILFGPPSTCAAVGENDQLNKTFVAEQNQSMSLADRYFATTNSNSLLMRTAYMVYTGVNGTSGGSHGIMANLFSLPSQLSSSIIGSATSIAAATTPCSQQNYGNVQFGWSKSEEALIDSSDSYLPLQNQKILDQSGKEAAIASDYSFCFGYDYNSSGDGSFDPTDSNGDLVLDVTGQNAQPDKDGSLGGLLSNGDIVRTQDGDVVPDQGTCSPLNLGINNPRYGDLVFRFRLAGQYYNTLNTLENLQTVTN